MSVVSMDNPNMIKQSTHLLVEKVLEDNLSESQFGKHVIVDYSVKGVIITQLPDGFYAVDFNGFWSKIHYTRIRIEVNDIKRMDYSVRKDRRIKM